MSAPESFAAFDRMQTEPDEMPAAPPRRTVPAWRAALVAVLLAVAIGAAYWWLRPGATEQEDLLVVLAEAADEFRPEQATTVPDQAQRFVLETLGWSISPPDLPSLALVGVGLPSIGEVRPTPSAAPAEIQVPAFRYEGSAGERAVLFAYDYILIDRIQAEMDLREGTYAALSEPTPVDSRFVDGVYVVTWRVRAMIFSAVTTDEAVADGIRKAVSA